MYERILLAADGSPHAEKAADAAIGLATHIPEAKITLLYVSASAPSRGSLAEAHFDVKSILEKEAHRSITNTEEKIKAAGIPFKLKVALGDAADQIVEHAEKDGYDVIVLGSRGLNAVSGMLMGSVSRKVSVHAKCPVLIVR